MEKTRINISSFVLKLVAIIGMACNHTAHVFGIYFPTEVTLALYSLGGLTFPIMAFLITQGYLHTSSLRRYALRLFIFALISQVPFSLLWGAEANVLFTLLIGLGIIYVYDRFGAGGTFILVLIAGLCLSYYCDWGIIGPLMIWLVYALRRHRFCSIFLPLLIPFALVGVYGIIGYVQTSELPMATTLATTTIEIGNIDTFELLPIQVIELGQIGYGIIGVGLAALLLCGYKGRRGVPMKWAFYVFYPLHLLILWAISLLII